MRLLPLAVFRVLSSGCAKFPDPWEGLLGAVRNCPRAEGVAEILLPGDPERKARAQRRVSGIPLDDGTWGQLVELAKRFGVVVPG